MATRGVQFVAYYGAWDTANNTWKTGDSANHSLQWVKDGTDAATTNAGAEIDATNSPGQYKVTITATEADCLSGQLNGKSSTADIEIIPQSYCFLQIPNAVAGATGGLFIAGTNAATTVTTSFTTTFTGNLTGSVASVTGAVGSVTGAVGSVTGAVGSVTGNVGGNVTGSVGSVVGSVGGNVTGSVGSVAGSVDGNVAGSVGSVTGDIGGLAAGAITDVADAVWDAPLGDHLDSGSTGEALNAAGAAGDPWVTALPGAYGAGSAGYIIGNSLGTISFPLAVAGAIPANVTYMNNTQVIGTGVAGDLWRG